MRSPLHVLRFLKRFSHKYRPRNTLLDRAVRPVETDSLSQLRHTKIGKLEIASSDYFEWLWRFFPEFAKPPIGDRLVSVMGAAPARHPLHKKMLELYTTYRLLDMQQTDTYLDAAGAGTSYVHKIECHKRYLHDISIHNPENWEQYGVKCILGDASAIPIPDEDVDKISCHHSFEHFQGDQDTRFIQEVARLLRKGGKACIIPIFLGDIYLEVSDSPVFHKWSDSRAARLVDVTATLPGGLVSGHFSRVYDLDAFQRRVLDVAHESGLQSSLLELRFGGTPAPDPDAPCHRRVSKLNFPYRVLELSQGA